MACGALAVHAEGGMQKALRDVWMSSDCMCERKVDPVASSPLLDLLLQVGINAYILCAARCTM
jgi:hypothetical protein